MNEPRGDLFLSGRHGPHPDEAGRDREEFLADERVTSEEQLMADQAGECRLVRRGTHQPPGMHGGPGESGPVRDRLTPLAGQFEQRAVGCGDREPARCGYDDAECTQGREGRGPGCAGQMVE
jgi:hypothetical protein